MISTPPAEPISVVVPETNPGVKKEKESDGAFFGIMTALSAISKGISAKAEDSEKTESGKSEDKDPGAFACMTALEQIYELLGRFEQSAGAEQKETIASAKAAITDILEGNGVSGNMDIAALLTGELKQLGSEEKEAILARMPQILEMAQEPGSAVKEEEIQLYSNLCPLENSSDQTEIQIQTAAVAGKDGAEETALPEKTEGSAVSPPGLEGADTALRQEESAERNQSGDAAADTGIKEEKAESKMTEPRGDAADAGSEEEKTELKKTEQPDMTNQRVAGMEGDTAASNEKAAPVHETVGGALQKLQDILSAYDETQANQLEIQLEPEKLGKLSISLSMDQDGLKAIIRTKDAQVQGLLASEISALVEKLSGNGVQIKRLDVVCSDPGNGQFGDRENGSPDPRRSQGSPWGRNQLKMQTAYDGSDNTQYYVSAYEDVFGSTVSYRV